MHRHGVRRSPQWSSIVVIVAGLLVASGCSGARPHLAAPDEEAAAASGTAAGGSRRERPGDRTAAVVADATRRALAGSGGGSTPASITAAASGAATTAVPAPATTASPVPAAVTGESALVTVGLPPVTPVDAPAPAPPPVPSPPEGRTVLTAPGTAPEVAVPVTLGERPAVGLGTDLGTITAQRPDCVTVDRSQTPTGVALRLTCPAPDGAVEHLLLHDGVVVQRAVNRPPSGVDVTPAVYEAVEPGMTEAALLALLPPCDLGSEHRVEGVLRRTWVCHNTDGAIAVFELTDGLVREKLEFGVL